MSTFIESLSLGSGAALVAVLSAMVALGMSFVHSTVIRWVSVVVIPFAISYNLYWLPVWLGAGNSEYAIWQLIFLLAWFPAGVASAALITFMVGRYVKPRSK